jgi:hypothetical protein
VYSAVCGTAKGIVLHVGCHLDLLSIIEVRGAYDGCNLRTKVPKLGAPLAPPGQQGCDAVFTVFLSMMMIPLVYWNKARCGDECSKYTAEVVPLGWEGPL